MDKFVEKDNIGYKIKINIYNIGFISYNLK